MSPATSRCQRLLPMQKSKWASNYYHQLVVFCCSIKATKITWLCDEFLYCISAIFQYWIKIYFWTQVSELRILGRGCVVVRVRHKKLPGLGAGTLKGNKAFWILIKCFTSIDMLINVSLNVTYWLKRRQVGHTSGWSSVMLPLYWPKEKKRWPMVNLS